MTTAILETCTKCGRKRASSADPRCREGGHCVWKAVRPEPLRVYAWAPPREVGPERRIPRLPTAHLVAPLRDTHAVCGRAIGAGWVRCAAVRTQANVLEQRGEGAISGAPPVARRIVHVCENCDRIKDADSVQGPERNPSP